MKRAVYDKQFKMAAVKYGQSAAQSIHDVAKELGISGTTLRRWINEYDEYGESAFPGHGVLSAMNQAIGREHPPEGLIVHTDRGAQYTSQRFQALLMRYSFRQSMSRKGNPYDNAIIESFYRTLKRELVANAGYDNPEQASQDIFKYIELYYNTKRIHSALGWVSPAQFEAQNS